ncbi:hypothetical protein Cgig2_027859 [Carnegiea gigantea]|uniref:Uncharacterized protein n=1 Tax=Carnegiea gigantea TaxID=171969 RepID=A0A9Q1GNL1_9CARY|nr:hypothetical protein Cgig2_027859 [Carnegiea gigantea]
MASNKPINTSLPYANRPKVPTGSSIKCLASDKSSRRRNLKCPIVESFQLGDDIEAQDAIFMPWRSLSNPQDNINEEYESKVIINMGAPYPSWDYGAFDVIMYRFSSSKGKKESKGKWSEKIVRGIPGGWRISQSDGNVMLIVPDWLHGLKSSHKEIMVEKIMGIHNISGVQIKIIVAFVG